MPNYNNVEAKLEQAFAAYLTGTVPGMTHYTGLTGAEEQLPKSWTAASEGDEIVQGSGVFHVPLEIGVESAGLDQDADTLAAHRQNVASVRDAVLRSDITSRINIAAAGQGVELTVIDVLNPRFAEATEDTNFRNSLILDVIVANASI